MKFLQIIKEARRCKPHFLILKKKRFIEFLSLGKLFKKINRTIPSYFCYPEEVFPYLRCTVDLRRLDQRTGRRILVLETRATKKEGSLLNAKTCD